MWVVESFASACSESVYNADSHQIGRRWSVEAIAWWQRAVDETFVADCALLPIGLPPTPKEIDDFVADADFNDAVVLRNGGVHGCRHRSDRSLE